MAGVMLAGQKAAGVARRNAVSRDPVLGAARCQRALVITGARTGGDHLDTVIVVTGTADIGQARTLAGSAGLVAACARASAIGVPDAVRGAQEGDAP